MTRLLLLKDDSTRGGRKCFGRSDTGGRWGMAHARLEWDWSFERDASSAAHVLWRILLLIKLATQGRLTGLALRWLFTRGCVGVKVTCSENGANKLFYAKIQVLVATWFVLFCFPKLQRGRGSGHGGTAGFLFKY